MTEADYIEALRTAARAGDRKAAAFLELFERHANKAPDLPTPGAPAYAASLTSS
jgi:hypothetical protein